MKYPDDNRPYVKKGDDVLLLNYTNAPYQMVYDTIKVIDEQNAIGVMHLGTFPNGIVFSTFVMARKNYPFEYHVGAGRGGAVRRCAGDGAGCGGDRRRLGRASDPAEDSIAAC